MSEVLLLAAGWLPLWILAALTRRKIRPGRLLMGAGLAAFVGGMCALEMRRHGLLAALPDGVVLGPLSFHLDEVLRFAFLGATGALAGETVLDRVYRGATGPSRSGR